MPMFISDIHECCICGKIFEGYGNNPEPVMPYTDASGNFNRCCNKCNANVVIPARMKEIMTR